MYHWRIQRGAEGTFAPFLQKGGRERKGKNKKRERKKGERKRGKERKERERRGSVSAS